MKLIKIFLIPLVSLVVCAWLLRSAYQEVKDRAFDQLNNQQLVLAETAARGIESFFDHHRELLTHLSKMHEIVHLDGEGKEVMRLLYLTQANEIKGITRVDASGRIVYTFPEAPGAIGTDVSSQEHVQRLMQNQAPVISDVFESVQGFKTVAFHVPVFSGEVFQGSLAVLIPFDRLSRKFLEPIKIGRDGYAWMISRKGIELYCPVPGHTGRSVFENCRDFPTILSMAEDMIKGNQGRTTYLFDRVRGEAVESVRKLAVYVPVRLGDTFWSIVVATPEEEALKVMEGFRGKWVVILGLLMLLTLLWTAYMLRTFKILEEEKKRKRAETALQESEAKYRELVESANSIIIRLDALGRVTFFNEFAERFFGFLEEEIIGRHVVGTIVPSTETSGRDLTALLEAIVRNPEAYANNENENMRRNGERVWIAWTNKPILDEDGRIREVLCVGNDVTDRKHAEQALRESEAQFKAIFETASIGMAQADPKTGQWLRVNRKMCEITGYSESEMLGMRIPEITHPADRERDWALFQSVTTGQAKSYRLEKRYIRKDGNSVWVNVNVTVIRDAAGRPMRSMAAVEDISERKQSEEAIAKERRLSEDIINSLPGIFYMYDDQGRLIRWNRKHEEVTGYASEEMRGMSILDWFSEEHRPLILSCVESVFAEGESYAEASLRIKDGSQIPYFFTGRLATLDGKPYLIGVGIDVAERKRLDAERALLATAIEQAEENVLVTDARRTIVYINPAFERSSGYRLEELKGKKLKDLRSDQHDEAFYRNMKETLDRGEVWMGVIINRGKDGAGFEIEGSISPLTDASGSITHYVAAGRNLSRLRKLERELYQAQKMESVGRLAGGVAHDFNNMLGVILGHTELALLALEPTQPLYNNLQEIQKAAQRSASLIRQLLAFARKQTISPKVLDINETVGSMLTMVRRLIGEDIELLWKPGEALWPVKVDPTQIDQILANLCVNARDAIAGVGKVIISTANVTLDEAHCRVRSGSFPGEFVRLSVKDDGCGMEEKVLDKLFEPFFTTKQVGRGTGLGLATVYGIVKQNNGFVEVSSKPGGGSTFHIYLPRAHVAISEEQSFQVPDKKLRGTETVLLVEDEESILQLSRRILEHLGYRVLAATNPLDAVELAKSHPGPIDLLLTDVIMPGMNGKEFTETLSTVKAGFRTVFMSGYTDDVIAKHGVLDRAVHFLEKPFSVGSLAAKVREVLDT